MVWFIFYFLAAIFACIGFVDVIAWAAVRSNCKDNSVYKIIPVGGEGKNTDAQLALLYACARWEANPSRQVLILYGIGLDEQRTHDCEQLAQGAGIRFVRSPDELVSAVASD